MFISLKLYHKFETVKGWRLHSYTNGEIEFVKDGDKL